MPAIDVTGNAGTTPGKYTLQSIIEATNNAFRQDNYNYRFIAFQYEGQFGIMLADSYGGAGFSILAGVSDGYGLYTTTYTNNVIDDRSNIGIYKDPLGFGTTKAKYAGPAYRSFFTSKDDISLVTRVNVPLKRNTF